MLSSVSVQSRALMHERVCDVDESVGVNETVEAEECQSVRMIVIGRCNRER